MVWEIVPNTSLPKMRLVPKTEYKRHQSHLVSFCWRKDRANLVSFLKKTISPPFNHRPNPWTKAVPAKRLQEYVYSINILLDYDRIIFFNKCCLQRRAATALVQSFIYPLCHSVNITTLLGDWCLKKGIINLSITELCEFVAVHCFALTLAFKNLREKQVLPNTLVISSFYIWNF